MSNHHAHRAFELLAALPKDRHSMQTVEIASAATAHALLAIAAKLDLLIEQHRIANAFHGPGGMGVFNDETELRPARDAARKLLGLEDKAAK